MRPHALLKTKTKTPIPEIYDNERLETNIPVGPVTSPKTRRNVPYSETKQIRQFTHCDNHAVQFTPSPSKFKAPSLTKNLPSILSTTEKFAQYTFHNNKPKFEQVFETIKQGIPMAHHSSQAHQKYKKKQEHKNQFKNATITSTIFQVFWQS